MNLRSALTEHNEKLWVIGIPENFLEEPLTPLPQIIDWFQNFLLTRFLFKNKHTVQFGEKLLMPSNGLTPTEKILVIGLGDRDTLDSAQSKEFTKILTQTLDELKEKKPWIIFPSGLPESFLNDFKKGKQGFENLNNSQVTAG